jgi:hypothetical protein
MHKIVSTDLPEDRQHLQHKGILAKKKPGNLAETVQ